MEVTSGIRVVQNDLNESVISEMKSLGIFEQVMREVPQTGLVIQAGSPPHGTTLFVGRFVGGRSLGWASVTLSGAALDTAVVRDMVARILSFYCTPEARIACVDVGPREATG
jgi:hypothetical protein